VIKRSLFALALAAALPVSAQAADDGLSFTYVEADYVNTDTLGLDLDGLALRGNVGFAEKWYGTASWSRASDSVDLGGGVEDDVDFSQHTIGVGFHTPIANNVHFLAEAAWLRYELQEDIGGGIGGSDGVDGYRATVGIRGLMGPKFEGEVKLHYADVQDFDGGIGGEINGVFHINQTWGVAAGYQTQSMDISGLSGDADVETWKLGVRASF
jgi:hypothetical protein